MMVDGRQLPEPKIRADYLAQALAVEGGHLFIGGGGWFLHYAQGATLHGYDLSVMKTRCVEAGLAIRPVTMMNGPVSKIWPTVADALIGIRITTPAKARQAVAAGDANRPPPPL